MTALPIRGCALHCEESGAGAETVVFSHGLFWSGRMFEAQRTALSARYRCLAYDLRGQGRSQVTPGGYDMDEQWLDAAALIEQLGRGPVHWVGLSMGGFLGMRLAARRPELIRSLCLLNTAADPEPRLNQVKYTALGALAGVVGFAPLVGQAMNAMFGGTFLRDPARASQREALQRELCAVNLEGARRSLSAIVRRQPVEQELPRITCPTLVLMGEEDRSIARARSERLARLIPGAQTVVIPRAGHSSTLEEPAAVTAALDAFLARVSARVAASP